MQELLRSFQTWVVGLGPAGWVLYALVYAVCCVLFVPASILTLGAGALYGLGTGTAIVLAGATLGATLSFLLAKSVLRKRIEKMTAGNAKFAALDRAIAKDGAKIVFLAAPHRIIGDAEGRVKAIEAVKNWKFEPAMKDGHPVAVQIAVEVDFHLY